MSDKKRELIGRIEMVPHGHICKLSECEPGFFLFNGNVFLKSEYGSNESFCESGEYFWGGTTTKEDMANLIVQPLIVEITNAEDL